MLLMFQSSAGLRLTRHTWPSAAQNGRARRQNYRLRPLAALPAGLPAPFRMLEDEQLAAFDQFLIHRIDVAIAINVGVAIVRLHV